MAGIVASSGGFKTSDPSASVPSAASASASIATSAPDAATGPFADAWSHAPSFLPFRPFATADERGPWTALPRALAATYVRRAAAHRERPWPQPLARDWARFFHDGNRSAYETMYGERRRRVADDLMSYGVVGPDGERGRILLDDIVDGVTLLCDEAAWQVPAHNAYVRDAPQLPWPDPDRPVLDLFACETGQLLASALHLAGDRMPEPIRRRIVRELTRRIVTPYLTDRFWWMGEGDGPTNNWTTWCTQNVLAVAFLAPFDDEKRRRMVTRAVASLDRFVGEYGDDGCCPEGAGYYHSAALCLFGAMRILADVAPDAFAPLWRIPKIANIATYIVRVRVGEDRYFNFSDCSIRAGLMGAREYLFAREVGDDAMARIAAAEWAHGLGVAIGDAANRDAAADADATDADDVADPRDPVRRINALYLMWEAAAANGMAATAASCAGGDPGAGCAGDGDADAGGDARETYFPSTGVAVMRGGGFDAAVKAGRNGFSHGHNDTGSVIAWRNGVPVLIDPGVEAYTRLTFSPHRYELWTMQSSWHNLPDFDGVMQRETPDCHAEDVHATFGAGRSVVEADLTHAWPAEAGLRAYRRRVTLGKATGKTPGKTGGVLRIHDEAVGDFRTATMHLMTAVEPEREDGRAVSETIGTGTEAAGAIGATVWRVGDAMLEIRGASGPVAVEARPIDSKLAGEWGTDRLWRMNVPFDGVLDVIVR